ncbi:MAG: twin-arginine translocation signal domain-containing protein, partial [Geminicoccaceae bacterium]|nr:twin-arginine translocation signal domain-containing protein [Geminicoccaceae bacterium]
MIRTGGLSRRELLRGAALGAAAAAASSFPAPYGYTQTPITLRLAGTGVNAFNEIAERCKQDLGFNLQITTLVSDDVVRRAVTQPT